MNIRIPEERIVDVVLAALGNTTRTIAATGLSEDGPNDTRYEQGIAKLRARGVQVKRKVFSRQGHGGTLPTQQIPFLRMLLIDDVVLFFGIPVKGRYRFYQTADAELIEAYREYFESLP